MKEQHLFLGRPADRSEPLTAAALQALPSPATPLPRSLPVPRNSRAQPGGVWQPGCCTHPHLEWALRPLLQHAGDNSPELRESSAINRVFPVPPHAQCHYAALTLLSTLHKQQRGSKPDRGSAYAAPIHSPGEKSGLCWEQKGQQAVRPSPHQLPSHFHTQCRALCYLPVSHSPAPVQFQHRPCHSTASTQQAAQHTGCTLSMDAHMETTDTRHPRPSHRGHFSTQGHDQSSQGKQWGAAYIGTGHHLPRAWQNTVSSPLTERHTGKAAPALENP